MGKWAISGSSSLALKDVEPRTIFVGIVCKTKYKRPKIKSADYSTILTNLSISVASFHKNNHFDKKSFFLFNFSNFIFIEVKISLYPKK